MNDNVKESITLITKCNLPDSTKESFWNILFVYPLPEKRLKLIDKLNSSQLSGVVTNHLMSVARKCDIPSVYIREFLELKKDLAKKRNVTINDEFWKKYIEKAQNELPNKTMDLIQAIKSSKIFKYRFKHLNEILKQESINKKIKKVKNS